MDFMIKILFHTNNVIIDKTTSRKFDKIVCVPLNTDILSTVQFLNTKKNISVYVSAELQKYFTTTDSPQSILLPTNNTHKKLLPRIAFYAQSDTLAHSTKNILDEIGCSINFHIFTPIYNNENATAFFKKTQYKSSCFSTKRLTEFAPDYLLLFNDWTKESIRILTICREQNIKTICLQESIIDFGSKNRMQYADNVFMQGIQSILDLNRKHYFLTGNPRYQKHNTPVLQEKALINCNFTYGIFEEWRERWLETITTTLSTRNIDFCISQHPRDNGDLSKYATHLIPSSSASVNQQIQESSFVITRFSSLIHEALLQYRPVIYFNPHKEELLYNFGFNNTFLFYATTPQELSYAIEQLKKLDTTTLKGDINDYLQCHCVPQTSTAAQNILLFLQKGNFYISTNTVQEKFFKWIYHPILLRPYFLLKRLFK